MSCSNTTLTSLFFLLIFLFKLNYSMGSNGIQVLCPEIEKHSLLSFKKGLNDPDNLMSSWDGGVDCCKWKGVVCDNFTGHVHQLHLQHQGWYNGAGLSGKINSSLLNLKHLRYLDLSYNDFTGETIPSFIGSLTNLEYLDLSDSEFQGKIPHNIGNLSNLQTLVLGGNELDDVDSLEWLRGLSELEHLNMNGVNMSKATNWVDLINTLPSLRQLLLERCSLDLMGTTPLHYLNLTSLTHLHLSHQFESFKTCQSSSSLLTSIFQLQNLVFLDLRFNCFQGPIPSISNSTKLKHIDLSHNHFNSSIPNWLYFCKGLEFVHLGSNLLEGTISYGIANLTSLKSLFLYHNQLSGEIPKEIADLSRIESLDVSRNRLKGEIPNSLAKLSSLMYLDMSRNNLTGNLPESLGQLINFENLVIGGNMLMSGVVTETHFANLTNLETFSASGNHLMSLKVSPDWIPPINLETLELGSWTLLGPSNHIPSWLHTPNNNISELDLSNTGISGNVPTWFWEISYLDLSNNHLHGNIPYIGARHPEVLYQYMYLSSNQFNGSLPQIGDGVVDLDLSNNSFSGGISHFLCDATHQYMYLENLHLGENQLSGELPPNCWTKWSSLRYLNLGNNNMSGTIQSSIGLLSNLMSLNLNGNKFTGQIPPSLHYCIQLVKIDLSDNSLHGNIPTQIGTSLDQLRILILHSNKLSGKLSSKLCHLNSLQILDLSNNNFSGVIPTCLYNFTAMATKSSVLIAFTYELGTTSLLYYSYSSNMYPSFMESVSVAAKGSELQYGTVISLVTNINLSKNNLSGDIPKELASLVELQSLDLSENQLTGLIPDSIGDMKQLQSLDFSRNFLSGQIPNSFTRMSFLSYMNLSYNNLTGRIPESTQLQSLDASSFTGNNLCGRPLTRNCSHDGRDEDKDEDEDEGEESDEIEWIWVFLSSGYAVGLSAVCSALVLMKSWRDAYFGFLEDMWNKFYVFVHIKWASLNF